MEESCEVREEDKVHLENSKKRMLKTPSQVEALEKLYNEHKYPTESIKTQLAEEIGLSEKQVSGWFCHRRLKDKNILIEARLNGRQDVSSSIVQDRGSALKQDSCSSTKPGGYRHFEPREVESRRLCGQDSPTEDLSYRNRGQYMYDRNCSNMDNTSSESTSASQERMPPHSKDPYGMESFRYSSRSINYALPNVKNLEPIGHIVGSEYLNSQDEIGNAAMLAVKRQLGRLYREDGPPLGVKFESLPPSAFDEPNEEAINGPYYVGDSSVPNSVGVLKVHKEPSFDTGGTRLNCAMRHSSYPEGDRRRIRLESDHRNGCSSYQSFGKSILTDCRSYGPRQRSLENIDGDPIRVSGHCNKPRKHGIRPMSDLEGMKSKSKSIRKNHLRPCDMKVMASGSYYPSSHDHDGSNYEILQNQEYLKGRPPMIRQYDEYLDTERRESSRMEMLDESLYGERRKCKANINSVRVNPQLNNKIKKKTKQSGEYLKLDYVSKTPSPHAVLSWNNQMKGCAGEIPTSFSDDETVATSSSMG